MTLSKRLTNRWSQRLRARQYRAPLSRRLLSHPARQLSLGHPASAACLSSGVSYALGAPWVFCLLGAARFASGPGVRSLMVFEIISAGEARVAGVRLLREMKSFLAAGSFEHACFAHANKSLQPTPMSRSVSSFAVTAAACAAAAPALARSRFEYGVSELGR